MSYQQNPNQIGNWLLASLGIFIIFASLIFVIAISDWGVWFIIGIFLGVGLALLGFKRLFGSERVSKFLDSKLWKYFGRVAFWLSFGIILAGAVGDEGLQIGASVVLGMLFWIGLCLESATWMSFIAVKLHRKPRTVVYMPVTQPRQ